MQLINIFILVGTRDLRTLWSPSISLNSIYFEETLCFKQLHIVNVASRGAISEMHAASKEGFFIHNIVHKANPAMHSVWQLNFDVHWCISAWKGNVKLAMQKNVTCEMKANMREGLPLKLVNNHGISHPQRKVIPCKCKWQTAVIENELNVRDKGHITSPFTYDDLSLNNSHHEAHNKRDPKF